MKTPEEARLEAALKDAVRVEPFAAERMLARALVAAYTPSIAEAVADRMGDMVRATLGAVRLVQPDIAGPLHDAGYDDRDMLPAPSRLSGFAWGTLGVVAVALMGLGLWAVGNIALGAVQRQIEAGAMEW